MRRVVKPELLDALPPDDPRAIASRADLRRLNFLLGHAGFRSRTLRRHYHESDFRNRPLRVVELGAGDGMLLLCLARFLSARGVAAEVTLLDHQSIVSSETLREFAALQWSVTSVVADALVWLKQPAPVVDVMFANLFLHEIPDQPLGDLLRLAAARTNLFIACEPRRSLLALTAARLLGLVGCNRISRHDGVISVQAGLTGQELSALWPANSGWELSEQPAGWFTHGFVARRNAAAAAV